MAWCASEDEICQAMERQWGKEPVLDGDDADALPSPEARLPTPSQLGITAGILSDVPAHLQVPPTDWSNMDLGLSNTDLASLAGGSPGYHLGGGGSGGFSPPSNIAPMGSNGLQNATQVYAALQSPPVNLNAGAPAPAPSLEDAARSVQFNMTDQDLANIKDYTDARLRDQAILRGIGSLAIEAIPEASIPSMAEKVLSRSMEAANQVPELNEEQQREQAFQEELWRVMNNRMLQSAMGSNSPPGMRGFFMK